MNELVSICYFEFKQSITKKKLAIALMLIVVSGGVTQAIPNKILEFLFLEYGEDVALKFILIIVSIIISFFTVSLFSGTIFEQDRLTGTIEMLLTTSVSCREILFGKTIVITIWTLAISFFTVLCTLIACRIRLFIVGYIEVGFILCCAFLVPFSFSTLTLFYGSLSFRMNDLRMISSIRMGILIITMLIITQGLPFLIYYINMNWVINSLVFIVFYISILINTCIWIYSKQINVEKVVVLE